MILGLALRLPGLARRPMHTDEAVHAIKFGDLLEANVYRYDAHEYHGPTLNYFSLIPAWLTSARRLTEVNEATLRIVPVCFGMLLILLLWPLRVHLGRKAVLWAALFTAVSPAMVFYSRYYIQEMLLVCFTFAALISGYRYMQKKQIAWAVITGVFLGLMHASKETCIIAYGAMTIAGLFVVLNRKRQSITPGLTSRKNLMWHVLAGVIAAFIVSAVFYTSYFSNWQGILDSFRTYGTYFQRAGQKTRHIHPWYFYFKLLIGSKQAGKPLWSELFIIIMACIGVVSVFQKKKTQEGKPSLRRFLTIYAIIMVLVYTLIPYKTPWSMLGFYHGLILTAGVGAAFLCSLIPRSGIRILLAIFILMNATCLAAQSWFLNFRYECDPSHPYVYAHPGKDVFRITRRIDQISHVHPDGKGMFIEVIYPDADYWPLPWYLRAYTRVGWWNEVDFSMSPAPVVLAAPDAEHDLLYKLYDLPPPGQRSLYVPLFDSYTELRPRIEIRGYVVKDLADRVHRETESN